MAKKRSSGNLLGAWAFLIGVILAVVLGFLGGATSGFALILVIIGLIIGLLNVTGKEINAFMMAGIVLIIASTFGDGVVSGVATLSNILDALLLIFVPAVIIVAIKSMFHLAKN
jgi:hypothetical protein